MPHKIKECLINAKQLLKDANIPSYALDANLIMAHTLNKTREYIACYPEKILSEEEVGNFENMINRRQNREPISHILGKREFFGREFKVTKDTLDPRPDSETLIEAALEIISNPNEELKILDLGTGTGCLLLTLLSEFPKATGVGVDISKKALEIANQNATKLGLAKRVDFVVSNWTEEIEGNFDLIISNPPYIINKEIDLLEAEVSIYEPRGALDGGNDGLDCYREISPSINSLITKGKFIILEFGIGQDEDIKSILENEGLEFISYKKDLAGINRCIIAKK